MQDKTADLLRRYLLDLDDRAVLLALLDTGCRALEFVTFDVQDVNMNTGAVIIQSGKGGKFRTATWGRPRGVRCCATSGTERRRAGHCG